MKRNIIQNVKIYDLTSKFIRGQISFFKLKTGLYRKESIPDYDFSSLISKWPYENPHCVSHSFSRMKQSNVDLSICIPAFNAERSIITLLNQIDRQKTSFRIEVLIVNDGSTDKTGSLVETFIKGKEHFHLFQLHENKGLSVARNKAIDNASGRYLTFIDSDDEIYDGFIDNLMITATSQNADIVRGEYCSKRGESVRHCGVASSFAWGKVYRASLFDNIRFPNGYWFEDMINNFLLTPLSKNTIEINVPVIVHNDLDGSLSKIQLSTVTYKSLEQLYLVMSLIKDYKALGLTDEHYLHKRILNECSRLMVRRTEKLDDETKRQVFLACNIIFSENEIKPKEFSGIDRIFANAIVKKDYAAWKLAADYAVVYNKIHR